MCAYRPPHLRNDANNDSSNNSNNNHVKWDSNIYNNNRFKQTPSSSRQQFHNKYTDYEYDELYEDLQRKIRQNNELRVENQKLTQELEQTKKQLAVYISKGPKVSQEEYDKLRNQFEDYKEMKYKEFTKIKDKLNNHDDEINNLNKEVRKLEEQLKSANQDVQRYKSSIHGLNEKIKELKQQQVEQLPEPQATNKDLIDDDWVNICKSLDYVLSMDKKIASKSGFNIPALKLTRSLIKQ